jgi:Uma2 family endonuclease
VKLQKRLEHLLEIAAGDRGIVTIEFPYRPLRNLQYWFADVAYIPAQEWKDLPPDEYPIYAPPLIVEVLSPSNTPSKVNRQRIVAMSAGTLEFWVVDAQARTVQITSPGGTALYAAGTRIPIPMFSADLAVDVILDL